jgi:hypothetical protein
VAVGGFAFAQSMEGLSRMVSGGLEKKRTNTNYPRDELELEEDGDSMNRILALWQDAEKASFLTHPALADISPTRPESAETASSPMDAPCPMLGRREQVN